MPLSTDVNLPKSHAPVFPDRCVACGVGSPDDSIRVATRAIGWWTVAFWHPGRRFTAQVPACTPCRRRMQRQKWLRLGIGGLFGAVGVGVAVWLLHGQRVPFRQWLALGIALACMLPYLLWEVCFPRPIDLTAYSETVDYEFRDAGYAEEFAALNGTATDRDHG